MCGMFTIDSLYASDDEVLPESILINRYDKWYIETCTCSFSGEGHRSTYSMVSDEDYPFPI